MLATIEQQAEARIRRHRARLLMTAPFYGAVGAELELVIDPDCGTAWTDGKRIGFAPDFALSLPAEHLRGVIAHEILHVAMRHNYRRGDRDQALWNEACDYAINGVLVRDGFALPEDALLDDRFDKLSAEQVYAALLDEQQQDDQQDGGDDGDDGEQQGDDQQQPQGGQQQPQSGDQPQDGQQQQQQQNGKQSGSQSGSRGEVRDAADDAKTEQDWQTQVVQASKLAQNLHAKGGSAAGEAAERAAADARKPKVDWRNVLQQFLTARTQDDFTWNRPSRRHLAGDLIMPSMTSDGAGVIAIAIDTSGSIDEQQLADFLSEIQGVVDQLSPERVIVWCCDTQVRGGTQTFERGDLIKPRIVGGGGTRFAPIFEALDETHEDVACLLYFTDGMGRMPKVAPSVPTLWAITTPEARHAEATRLYSFADMPTFGDIIYLED